MTYQYKYIMDMYKWINQNILNIPSKQMWALMPDVLENSPKNI